MAIEATKNNKCINIGKGCRRMEEENKDSWKKRKDIDISIRDDLELSNY